MAGFQILHADTVIGTSELETGDPPMGVASGRFFPTAAYEALRPLFSDWAKSADPHAPAEQKARLAELQAAKDALPLFVRTAAGEDVPTHWVHIDDYVESLGPTGIEVSLVVASREVYERLFPDRG